MPLKEVIAALTGSTRNMRSNLVGKWIPFFNTKGSGFVFVCVCVCVIVL